MSLERILLVLPDAREARDFAAMLAEVSARKGEIVRAGSLAEAEAMLLQQRFDVAVLDLDTPDAPGLLGVAVLAESAPDMAIVPLARPAREVDALKAAKAGASDYLLKGQLFGTLVDRTLRYAVESRRATRTLQSSGGYFRALIENASGLVGVLERDGTWRYLAPSVHALLGYHPEDLVGHRLQDFIYPEDEETAAGELERVASAPHARTTAGMRFRHHDGSWHSFDVTLENHLDDPVVAGIVANAADTSERKAAEEALGHSEEQLRQFQRIEAIGRLAGGVAHDFNNLLTAMSGHIYLLSASMAEEDPRRLHVDEIKRGAARAAALTRQLLAFSRKQVLRPRVININAVVGDLGEMLRRLIGEDVELVATPAPDLGSVKADHAQLEQVLMNLALNARDAMPDGGRLTIETANAFIGPDHPRRYPYVPPGPYVMLAVSDTGHGMDEAVRSRAFEPFFTTKEVGKGTGLGLSTVYGIVKQSQGFIWIDTAVGAGTRVEIYLPRVDAAEDADLPERVVTPPPVPADGRETILLVEDEDAVRALADRVLRRSGYNVLVARNGVEALEIADKFTGTLHLLVSDLVMPQLGGREVARALLLRVPPPRILFMSGYVPDEFPSDEHFLADAYLQKPFTPDVLARIVRELLDVS